MDVLVDLFTEPSPHLPAIFNVNFEDENQRHLYYQVLAMKIFIFTYVSKPAFPLGCCMIFLCIPYCFRRSVGIGSRLLTSLHYTTLLSSADGYPMQLHYVLVFLSTILFPEIELLIDVYLLLTVMYVYRNYLVPQLNKDIFYSSFAFGIFKCFVLSRLVSAWILWSMAALITLRLSFHFKETIPSAWAHLPCAYIIWIVYA